MSFVLKKAPASLTDISSSKKNAKKSEGESGSIVSHDKELHLDLDVSHDAHTKALDWLFPGHDFVSKAMSGVDAMWKQTLRNTRKLGKVSVTIHDGEGRSVVHTMQTAELRGANSLVIGQRGATRMLPVKIVGPVPRELLPKLDDYLRADVLVDIQVSQLDLEDELKKSGQRTGKGKGKKGATTVVVDEEGQQAEMMLD